MARYRFSETAESAFIIQEGASVRFATNKERQTEGESEEEEKITAYEEFRAVAEAKYFVPQGMDVWENKELLFISGYFKNASDNTSGSPSSLLLIIDLKTGKHVGTYCLKNSDSTYSSLHVGGMAITEKNCSRVEHDDA